MYVSISYNKINKMGRLAFILPNWGRGSDHRMTYSKAPNFKNKKLLGYVRRQRDGVQTRKTFQAKSLRCIVVGKSSRSDGLEFYHPQTKHTITSSDFRLDPTQRAGPVFNLNYDGGIFFNVYDNDADKFFPPGLDIKTQVYVTTYDPPQHGEILAVPIDDSDIYTVQIYQDGSIHQFPSSQLLEYDPRASPEDTTQAPSLPRWVHPGVSFTAFLSHTKEPKQGRLLRTPEGMWQFQPGHLETNPTTDLPDFPTQITSLIKSKQLYKGLLSHAQVVAARQTQNYIILWHDTSRQPIYVV